MRPSRRIASGAIALVLSAGLFAVPTAARASEEGRRNTAIALGAAAGYLLLKEKNKLPGVAAAAGAAYAYKRYNDSIKKRHERERRYGHDDRYDRYDDRYDRHDNRYDRYDDRYDRYDRDYRYDAGRYDRDDRYDTRYDSRYDRNSRYDDRYYRDSRYDDRYSDPNCHDRR